MKIFVKGFTSFSLAALLIFGSSPTAVLAQTVTHTQSGIKDCKKGYYKNVNGSCVKSPTKSKSKSNDFQWVPGATAYCSDGTFSYSQNRRGTCSRHGGVAKWR